MPNLKEVRNRISSVGSTQQITKAMKMVSAAKLRRATDAVLQLRPYANKLKDMLGNLTASLEDSTSVYAQEREVKNVLLIAITSNRGLCGGFNSAVIKATNRLIAEKYMEHKKKGALHMVCVGKKAQDYYSKLGYKVVGNNNHIFNNLNWADASVVVEEIMTNFANGTYDHVEMVYNQFKNAAVQILTVEQLLPVKQSAEQAKGSKTDYLLEPSQEEIVNELIPKSVKIQFYKGLLDSHASEHGARMTAMDKATENAGDLLKSLKLSYNQARQAAITKEILEIVSGAAALSEG